MSESLQEREMLYAAKKKVKKLKSLYLNFILFVGVNCLILLNYVLPASVSSNNYYYLVVLWGAYLMYSSFTVIGSFWIFSDDWEENKIQEILHEMQSKES